MRVRDIILIIYGIAIVGILLDIAVQVKRTETDVLISRPVWTMEI